MALSVSQKEKLLDTKYKLRRIFEITEAINHNEKAATLFQLFAEILGEDLKISKAVFISQINGEWKVAFEIGTENFLISESVMDLLHSFYDIGNLSEAADSTLKQFDLVIPILHKKTAIGYLLLQDATEETNQVSALIKNLNYMQSTANIIMVAIENKRMAKAQIEQELLKKELSLAKQIQKGLLPNNLPDNESLSVQAFHQSYGEVGGDYYDFIQISDSEYFFCMADISGKGISAAILMSNFQATFRTSVRQNLPFNQLLSSLNTAVLENSGGDKFITIFIGKYNQNSKELQYINCAHPSALLIEQNRIIELRAQAPGLGMLESLGTVNENSITLSKPCTLACYTDGITELENSNDEQYGIERLKESISNSNSIAPIELINHVSSDLNEYALGKRVTDDIAALAIQFKIDQ